MSEPDKDLIEVEILKVLVNENSCIVFLKEKSGKQRVLSIWVGIFEGRGIIMAWEGTKSQRPFTYELYQQILTSFNLKVQKMVIQELKDHVFYGFLYVTDDQTVVEHDVRPSDGMALALRFGAPIFIHKQVFQVWQDEASKQGEMYSIVDKSEGKSIFDILEEDDSDQNTNIGVEIKKLNKKLETAIKEEHYEEAADLRDQIGNLKQKQQRL